MHRKTSDHNTARSTSEPHTSNETANEVFEFLYRLVTLTLLALLMIFLFSRFVDPYGLWQAPRLGGVNKIKPERESLDYLFKPGEMIRTHPHIVLVGSSRVAKAYDPSMLNDFLHTPMAAYNAGLIGGNLMTARKMIEIAIQNNPNLHTIVLGLDFFSFNQNLVNSYAELGREPHATLSLNERVARTLSFKALNDSGKTLCANLYGKGHDSHSALGLLHETDPNSGSTPYSVAQRFKRSLALYTNSHPHPRYKNFVFDDTQWLHVEHIVELAKNNNIELAIFTAPLHMSLFESMYIRGIWDDYVQWLATLSDINEFWDYSLPNSINSEPIDYDMEYYSDASHYTVKLGQLVLADIFDSSLTKKTGTLVTASNVQSHVRKVRGDFLKWRSRHLDIVNLVRAIATTTKDAQ